MRLVPPPGKITGGRILPEEHDLLGMSDEAMVKIRGKRISMIFQNPLVSLNPVYRVGSQVKEAIVLDQAAQLDAWRKAVDIMAQVRVADAERCRHEEPQLVQAGHGHEVACHRWEELTLTAAPGDDRLATGEDR
jgi:ABC-type dipeptide/oligopeptide/nickel transport system ATPase component